MTEKPELAAHLKMVAWTERMKMWRQAYISGIQRPGATPEYAKSVADTAVDAFDLKFWRGP